MTDAQLVRLAGERVMGWRAEFRRGLDGREYLWMLAPGEQNCREYDPGHRKEYRGWHPLTDIRDATMLIEALRPRFRRIEAIYTPDGCLCQIADGTSEVDEAYIAAGVADTAPRAIVMACLRAVGVEI